jgi:hypothetical protein
VEIPAENAPVLKPMPLGDYDIGGVKLTGLLTGPALVAYITPSHEPSEHLLDELMDARADYSNKGIRLIIATTGENETIQRLKTIYGDDLTLIFVKDDGFAKYLAEKTGLTGTGLPIAAMAGSDGTAAYYARGYHVGSAILALNYIS